MNILETCKSTIFSQCVCVCVCVVRPTGGMNNLFFVCRGHCITICYVRLVGTGMPILHKGKLFMIRYRFGELLIN